MPKFVDPDVVDQHRLRKLTSAVRIPRPSAAHSDVKQAEEGVVINPLLAFWKIGGRAHGIEIIVDIKADDPGYMSSSASRPVAFPRMLRTGQVMTPARCPGD